MSVFTRGGASFINVVNKPGGNTIPGTLEVYSAAPDGYTILADGLPMSSLLEVVAKDLPFKVMDRTFIAMTVYNPLITIVPASSPYKTVHDLIADARKDPANFTWDSLGGVSGDDFVGRMIMNAAKIDIPKTKPVMSKGGAEAAVLVAGGNIKMGNPASISALPHIQAGTVRAVAVALKERDPLLPDVPTWTELGFPSVYCPFWLGVSGPPKLPPHVVQAWASAVADMMKNRTSSSSRSNCSGLSITAPKKWWLPSRKKRSSPASFTVRNRNRPAETHDGTDAT